MVVAQNARARPVRFVAYFRVSTTRQGHSGLGLEAQRESVARYLEANPGQLVAEFTETASGLRRDRPELKEAIRVCRVYRATLIIARLDRLARSLSMITDLMESGLKFVAADFPHANELTIHVLAAIAEYESKLVSDRVKGALAAAKARGVRIGRVGGFRNPDAAIYTARGRAARSAKYAARYRDLGPLVWELVANGFSATGIADELNRRGISSVAGRPRKRTAVNKALARTRGEFGASQAAREARRLQPRHVREVRQAIELAPLIWAMRMRLKTLEDIARELERRGVPTPRGRHWYASRVSEFLRLTRDEHGQGAKRRIRGHKPAGHPRASTIEAIERAWAVAPIIWRLRAKGLSHQAVADEMNGSGVPAARTRWGAKMVRTVIRRMASTSAVARRKASAK